jgi:hypothetical protein
MTAKNRKARTARTPNSSPLWNKLTRSQRSIGLAVTIAAVVLVVGFIYARGHIHAASDSLATDTVSTVDTTTFDGVLNTSSYNKSLCETWGSFCANTSSFNIGIKVREHTPGRTVGWQNDGGTFCFKGNCYVTGVLKFVDQTDRCMVMNPDSSTDLFVEVNKCSDVSGVTWAAGQINGHDVFINRRATFAKNSFYMLSARSVDDNIFYVEPLGKDGWFQKFYFGHK